jgi:hypothetical protein
VEPAKTATETTEGDAQHGADRRRHHPDPHRLLAVHAVRRRRGRIGPRGIDAATRIVGFFVSAMGMGLIFHGVTEAIQTYMLGGTH